MKKSKLIEMLNAIEGDPDIFLWNGYVADWMDIGNLREHVLVKECKNYYRKALNWEALRDKTPEMSKAEFEEFWKKHSRKQQWEFPNEFLNEEQYKDWYGNRHKQVVLITAKVRGETSYDRCGSMSY